MRRKAGKLAIVGLLALGLVGCANLNPDIATPNQEIIALNAYTAAVKTGKNYLLLPLCPESQVCRTQALSQRVYGALRAARAARLQITASLKADQKVPLTAIAAMQAAYAVIQLIPN